MKNQLNIPKEDNSLDMELSFFGTSINDVFESAKSVVLESGVENPTVKDLLEAIEHVASRSLDDYREEYAERAEAGLDSSVDDAEADENLKNEGSYS